MNTFFMFFFFLFSAEIIEVEHLNNMELSVSPLYQKLCGVCEVWYSVFLQVWCGDRHQLLPDNIERFDRVVCILGRERISSGRHYWEVRGSLLWVCITLLFKKKKALISACCLLQNYAANLHITVLSGDYKKVIIWSLHNKIIFLEITHY